jgi:hypothetical protein
MSTRRCITSDEAVKVSRQSKKPCTDCPWARASLKGWLGPLSAEQWLTVAHGDGLVECHTMKLGWAKPMQCAGAAIYRRNVAKTPRATEALRLPADRERVFASPSEFVAHHTRAAKAAAGEDDWVCTRCDGSGDDPDGGACDVCQGTGREGL